MFIYADKDGDGKISYTEFQIMINPPKPPEPPRPTLADLARKTKTEDHKASTIVKVTEIQPTPVAKNTEPKTTQATDITEPQTLSVANIMIHNANNKAVQINSVAVPTKVAKKHSVA